MVKERYFKSKEGETIERVHCYVDTLRDASFLFEKKVEELSLLKRIGDIVGYIFDQEVFYRKFMDILLEETNAENCSFMLMDDDANGLVLKMARGRNDDGAFFEHPRDSGTVFSLGEGVAGLAALKRETILLNEVKRDKRFQVRETCVPIGSLLCVPLIFQEKLLGVINLSHTRPHAFSENDRRVMKLLCAFVGAIIGNAIAYIRVRDQEKFKAMCEGVRLAILLLDPETMKILDCNRYTEDSLGYSREELIGIEHIFAIIPQGDREKAPHLFTEIAKKGGTGFYELSFTKKDGSVIIGEISGAVISYQEKSLMQLMIKDITEKKGMEERLLQTKKLTSLGELAGGVAHDFNNMLATIIGRTQLLRKSIETPLGVAERSKSIRDLKKSLEIIEKAAFDGAETVRRIQEFSGRREDDRHFSSVNLKEVVEQALEFTRVRWKNEAELKGIPISIQKKISPVPPIAGNSTELREVLINLIINAIEAMPDGGSIKINIYRQKHYAFVKVEDTGTGISNAIGERIFDPFFTTKGVQSTGLGLSVSYGIINRHRGTITVESVEGKGTTFTIKLPLSERAGEETRDEKEVNIVQKEQRKGRILVIEDEEDVRELLKDVLRDGGHEVETAPDGKQALEIFKKDRFDLVFTDLGMPGMSGWQVAEEIKKINGKIPIALITGWKVQLDKTKLKESGVDFVINKPFLIHHILQLVEQGLRVKKGGEEI